MIHLVVPAAIHPVDEAIFDVQINLATHTAVRAGGGGNAIRGEHGMFRVAWCVLRGELCLSASRIQQVNGCPSEFDSGKDHPLL